jgi:hypothetical protein
MKTAAESFLHPDQGTQIAFDGHNELALVHEGCMQSMRELKEKNDK